MTFNGAQVNVMATGKRRCERALLPYVDPHLLPGLSDIVESYLVRCSNPDCGDRRWWGLDDDDWGCGGLCENCESFVCGDCTDSEYFTCPVCGDVYCPTCFSEAMVPCGQCCYRGVCAKHADDKPLDECVSCGDLLCSICIASACTRCGGVLCTECYETGPTHHEPCHDSDDDDSSSVISSSDEDSE